MQIMSIVATHYEALGSNPEPCFDIVVAEGYRSLCHRSFATSADEAEKEAFMEFVRRFEAHPHTANRAA